MRAGAYPVTAPANCISCDLEGGYERRSPSSEPMSKDLVTITELSPDSINLVPRTTGGSNRSPRPGAVPSASVLVDVAAIAEGHDHNEQHIVSHGVDNSVVPDPDSVTRSTAKRPGRRRARVLGEQRDGALNARPSLSVQFLQRPRSRGAQLDRVGGHTQPRSALTCSQGMLAPSSAIEASKAAMSSASSKTSMSSS